MKSILDPLFRYTPAAQTDIRKTIRREQKRIELERQREKDNAEEAQRVVKPLIRAKP